MPHALETRRILDENRPSSEKAALIARYSRGSMIELVVGTLVSAGAVAATLGPIFGGMKICTQTFEKTGDENDVWAIAELSAVAVTGGVRRLNRFLTTRDPALP